MTNLDALTRIFNSRNPLPAEVTITCLAEKPCPVLGLTWPADWRDFEDFLPYRMAKIHSDTLAGGHYVPRFRCVESERLPYVLANGCDVDPTDAVLWVDMFPGKALDYGGETKVMMVFDARKLENSGQKVRADIAPEELERLRAVYPTELKTTDEEYLWLSRLPESDRRMGSPHEVEHGRWIPGNPWDALRLVIVLAHDSSLIPDLSKAQSKG